jgi:hypothetical protein
VAPSDGGVVVVLLEVEVEVVRIRVRRVMVRLRRNESLSLVKIGWVDWVGVGTSQRLWLLWRLVLRCADLVRRVCLPV